MFGFWRRRKVVVEKHWYVPLLDFHVSTQEFYSAIENELKERKVPDLEIGRVDFAEGGLFSAHRQYLRLRRERLIFDICSSPFGTSWFFSLRGSVIPRHLGVWHLVIFLAAAASLFLLYSSTFGLFTGTAALISSAIAVALLLHFSGSAQGMDGALLQLPIVGVIYETFFRRETYYREDTRLMYLDIVEKIVQRQVDAFTGSAGVKLLNLQQVSHEPGAAVDDLLSKVTTVPVPR
jgi:hypothetical protein